MLRNDGRSYIFTKYNHGVEIDPVMSPKRLTVSPKSQLVSCSGFKYPTYLEAKLGVRPPFMDPEPAVAIFYTQIKKY